MNRIVPILMIAVSAALWGLIAIFVRKLAAFGFTPMEIVTIRVFTAVIILGVTGTVKNRTALKIRPWDLKLFLGTGICSIVLFNWCYFTSINHLNLSLAVILLYTAPAFVSVMSMFIFKEKLDIRSWLSVVGTVLGCVLIAGVNMETASALSPLGILTGLGAGFGYALYTIFGKFALDKYQPFTVTFYTFLLASVTLIPITRLWEKWDLIKSGEVLLYGIGLGLFPTVIAYLLYTKGLEKMESSKASIISTVEPVVATVLSVFFYHESFSAIQLTGTLLIIGSVILVNLNMNLRSKSVNKKASI